MTRDRTTPTSTPHARAFALLALAGGSSFAMGCGDATAPRPDPAPTASANVAPTAASSVVVPPPEPPTLGLVPAFREELKASAQLFQVGEAVVVASGPKVGRLTKEGISWLDKRIAEGSPALGPNVITWIGGRYPDAVDVVYRSDNGRAPTPTYFPLTGKGYGAVFAPGGGAGWISGVATVGETTLLAGGDWQGYRIISVRGPKRKTTSLSAAKAGCTAEEVPTYDVRPRSPALEPNKLAATSTGRAVTLGNHCGKRGTALEVWDVAGEASTFVSLKEHVKTESYGHQLLTGAGEEMFVVDGEDRVAVMVDLAGPKVTRLPALPGPKLQGFVSSSGQLHVSDGLAIHRWGGSAWTMLAHLQWPTTFSELAVDGDTLWATRADTLYRLTPAKSVQLQGECATPFVWLYDVSYKSEPTYTFPTTRKALASFPKVGELRLVDFQEGARRLGLVVPSVEVGREVIAHVKATMKDEKPELLCYTPPEKARVIPL